METGRQPYGRPQVHQLPMSGESSPTAAKVGDSSPRPQMCQLQLPNAISEAVWSWNHTSLPFRPVFGQE